MSSGTPVGWWQGLHCKVSANRLGWANLKTCDSKFMPGAPGLPGHRIPFPWASCQCCSRKHEEPSLRFVTVKTKGIFSSRLTGTVLYLWLIISICFFLDRIIKEKGATETTPNTATFRKDIFLRGRGKKLCFFKLVSSLPLNFTSLSLPLALT